MAPIYKDWCFEAIKGTQPNFILKSDKKFVVSVLSDSSVVDPTTNLVDSYLDRILSIRIDLDGILMNSLNRKPSRFKHLTSLDLESVEFWNESLLMLAPQIENLRLAYIQSKEPFIDFEEYSEFDISSVDENSMCFTKLKTLTLWNIQIDVKKILTKCCNILVYLELDPLNVLDNLEQDLTSLKHLSIDLVSPISGEAASNLLTKCSSSLRTLKLTGFCNVQNEFLALLAQNMKITNLEIESQYGNFEKFFKKCPLIQKLKIMGHEEKIKHIVLKDLINLELHGCKKKCITSLLKQTSKSLKTLHLTDSLDEIMKCKLHEIPKLDTVWINYDIEELGSDELDKVRKLFPTNAKVKVS